MRRLAVLAAVAACAAPVDVAPPGDYTAWARLTATGPAPGHGDTNRVIYANDVARTFTGGRYPDGTIVVKEIYEGDALAYLAIMRRLDGDWLFTRAASPGGEEIARDSCWTTCHVAAPYDGAFLDYSRATFE